MFMCERNIDLYRDDNFLKMDCAQSVWLCVFMESMWPLCTHNSSYSVTEEGVLGPIFPSDRNLPSREPSATSLN